MIRSLLASELAVRCYISERARDLRDVKEPLRIERLKPELNEEF
jgi:hypothetical protein